MAQTLTDKSTNSAYKISFKKIARAAAAETRVHKKIAMISYILYGVALLLFIFDSHYYVTALNNDSYMMYVRYDPSMWGTFFAVAGVILGYFAALNMFRDVNNQQFCDVSMALPIKSGERFLSKLLALFYVQTAPLIVSTLSGNGLAVLFGSLQKGYCDGTVIEAMFSAVLMYLAASMFIMSIVVLCTCCCGAAAESAYFSMILIFIINALPLSFVFNILCKCAGFQGNYDRIDIGYWGFLFLSTGEKLILHCAVGCVISLAVMLLSGLIYVKRDARTVGPPIASRVFFEAMLVLGCITVFSLFALSSTAIWGVIIAAVAYIIINIIVCRAKINALSFLKWAGKYVAVMAVFAALLIPAIKTGGFGYIELRPETEYLDKVTFQVVYYDTPYDYYSHAKTLRASFLSSEQADQVMKIVKKHIANGRASIDPVKVAFDNVYSDDISYVRMWIKGSKTYDDCPYPGSQFSENARGFYLDYYQYAYIPIDEARAMAEELHALEFVHEDDGSETADTETGILL